MNTGALLNRLNFALALAANKMPGVRSDVVALIPADAAADPHKSVDALAQALTGGDLSEVTRATIRARLVERKVDPWDNTQIPMIAGLILGVRNFRKQCRVPEFQKQREPGTQGASIMNRRIFLKNSGMALVAGGLLPNVFVRMAQAGTTKGKKVLVAIFQRGAVDGLNVIVPYGETQYYAARPTIAVPRPGSGEAAALDLDGFFGLHPAMASVLPYFKDRSAAFVQAVGSPDTTRSHFDAQDFMESGTPGVKSTEDGFSLAPLQRRRSGTRLHCVQSLSLPHFRASSPAAAAPWR